MSQDERDSSDEVGTVAEEAAKLLGALSDWAKDHLSEADAHLATGAQECTYCPICKTVHLLRQTSPEMRAQLAGAATSLLQVASGLLATAVPDQQQRGGVEHIDLDDDTHDWPEDTDPETDPEEGDR